MRSCKHAADQRAAQVQPSGNITFVNSEERLELPCSDRLRSRLFGDLLGIVEQRSFKIANCTPVSALTDPRPWARHRASDRLQRDGTTAQRGLSSSAQSSSKHLLRLRRRCRRRLASIVQLSRMNFYSATPQKAARARVCRMCLSIDRREFCFVRCFIIHSLSSFTYESA